MTYDDLDVCYSWYGPEKRWLDGALKNARIAPETYPGCRVRIWYDSSVPDASVEAVRALGADMIDATHLGLTGSARMMWRFMGADPATDPRPYMLSRDLDSRTTTRERWCLDHWREHHPAQLLFTMADSESHWQTPIMGGMWGTKTAWRGMATKIRRFASMDRNNENGMGLDQEFLRKMVVPVVAESDLMTVYAGGRAWPFMEAAGATPIPDSVPYVGSVKGGHIGCPD